MPIVSGGATIPTTWASPYEWSGTGAHPLAQWLGRSLAYDEIYRTQLWVNASVNKLVGLHIQLPMKVYYRAPLGREDARGSAFGQLMARPSPVLNPVKFWGWFIAQHHIHGRAFARKIRDAGDRPVALSLIHPTRMRYGPEGGGVSGPGPSRWWLNPADGGPEREIPRRDLVIWSRFDSNDPMAGLSPMEPLRQTLENEDAARRANAAMWRNGGQHNFALVHPRTFKNDKLADALRKQYATKYGGVDNWGQPLVLQEDMKPVALPRMPDLEYIDTRKLNREEVAAEYDLPPNSIGINDRSTFSNVTEQNRSIYRQTMPTHLQGFEAAIDFDLRDGRFGEDRDPDFGEGFYFESLVDGVMRGSYEDRIDAHAKGIQTGQVTPAEVREMENRKYIEGSDVLLINAAVVPIEEASRSTADRAVTPLPDDGTSVDAAALLEPAGADGALSTVMGRLSRPSELAEIDPARLVDGLDDGARALVLVALQQIRADDGSVADLRNAIKQLLGDRR